MADINRLLTAVEKSQSEIGHVKDHLEDVIKRMDNLKDDLVKNVESSLAIQKEKSHTVTLNSGIVETALEKISQDMSKFKAMVRDAAAAQEETRQQKASLVKKKIGHDDKSRSLFERAGGDRKLEAVVANFYDKAVAEPRTRAYFEKNTRKVKHLKQKIQAFLAAMLGGPYTYDTTTLKPAHYYLNVTDLHFDCVVELFVQAFNDVGVHPAVTEEAGNLLGKTRRQITTGYIVRTELARRSNEGGLDALYEKLIGEHDDLVPFIERLMDIFSLDQRIVWAFEDKDIEAMQEGLLYYLTDVLGGPLTYKGKSLSAIHRSLDLNDYHFDAFLMDVEKALSSLGVDDDTVDEIIVILEPQRASVLSGQKRRVETGARIIDGKNLLERLGGEMAVEAVVDTLYGALILDPRVKFFFLLDASRMRQIKTRMTQLLVGACGGPRLYDIAKLKPAHFHHNITDYHFDAVCENLRVSCEVTDIPSAFIDELLETVVKFRQQITSGCTIRLEIAHRKTESAGTDSLYSQLGMKDGIVVFVDKLFKRLHADQRIAYFFAGSKTEVIKEKLSLYLDQIFGGVDEYTGRDIAQVHSLIQISDFHFDCFIHACAQSFAESGLDEDSTDECVVLLEANRASVVNSNRRDHDVRKMLALANKKTLFEILGGESSITGVVDKVYEMAVLDSRLRSFFEKNKAKIQSIKKKMSQYVCGLVGGPVKYDEADLQPAHYAINITNYHFDSILELFRICLIGDNVERSVVRDFIKTLHPVRRLVTTGFTLRTELAKRNLEHGRDQLFRKLGESEGILALIDKLFGILFTDPRVKDFFADKEETKVKAIKKGITTVLVETWGGPKAYQGREIANIHREVGLNDYHFDAFLADLQKALMGGGADEQLIDEVIVTVEPLRQGVLSRKENDATQLAHKDGALVERLGGDLNLESMVENLYEKCQEDTRIKYFFDKGKSKVRQVRMKMYQLLSGLFGGPVQYDIENLKPAHYAMNIKDYHFDTVLELAQEVMSSMDLNADAIDDALQIMNMVRSGITTGSSVRTEMARRQGQIDGHDFLFTALGGPDGTDHFVVRLFEVIGLDRRLNMFFDGDKVKAMKSALVDYMTMVFGGPAGYVGRPLEEIHAVLSINDFHFDCFLNDAQKALRDLGMEQDVVDYVLVTMDSQRPKVLKHFYEERGIVYA
ncbi:hypothetical protein FOL47_010479 [Perkinsus chesapeaki]|uniref:Uncharacterized protein n=1 Tax=Perkinsus chesapeaki TaxID=330153 RepID=A0A7J6L300_PERCH|nr:hypothetical protein FOL47_010479 [Perkinsus chesapeaki]